MKPDDPDWFCPKDLPESSRGIDYWDRVHYVHVPKSGGTAFGQVIRLLVCKMNEAKGAMDGR